MNSLASGQESSDDDDDAMVPLAPVQPPSSEEDDDDDDQEGDVGVNDDNGEGCCAEVAAAFKVALEEAQEVKMESLEWWERTSDQLKRGGVFGIRHRQGANKEALAHVHAIRQAARDYARDLHFGPSNDWVVTVGGQHFLLMNMSAARATEVCELLLYPVSEACWFHVMARTNYLLFQQHDHGGLRLDRIGESHYYEDKSVKEPIELGPRFRTSPNRMDL